MTVLLFILICLQSTLMLMFGKIPTVEYHKTHRCLLDNGDVSSKYYLFSLSATDGVNVFVIAFALITVLLYLIWLMINQC